MRQRISTPKTNSTWNRQRKVAGLLFLVAALLAPLAAGVSAAQAKDRDVKAAIPESLLSVAQDDQSGLFDVLVQGGGSDSSDKLADKIAKLLGKGSDRKALGDQLKAQFKSVKSVQVALSGKDILKLAKQSDIVSIIPNAAVSLSGLSNPQKWPSAVGLPSFWTSSKATTPAPTIAIVDSGVDTSAGQFGNRLLAQVDLGGGSPVGDSRGHGTFVAGLAASSGRYSGAAPAAKLVSLDVFDAQGNAEASDVIAAADWILDHKDQYNIRVANFSLQTGLHTSFVLDPLDQAVERLWQAGIVVVASSGNFATDGRPSGIPFAPGNDPFVLTVGAVDIGGTTRTDNDVNAPWSSYGYTADGFAKPEVGAPGRYMIQQIPLGASIIADFPANLVAPGTLQLSGTSFSAPIVAGMAADLLAQRPSWTPDQVKGALMSTATPLSKAAVNSLGLGEVNLTKALGISTPPNPNRGLNQFLVPDQAGGSLPVFDGVAWMRAAQANPAWNAASWSSASWASASWSSASWASASWSTASWCSASWSSASWSNLAARDGRGDG